MIYQGLGLTIRSDTPLSFIASSRAARPDVALRRGVVGEPDGALIHDLEDWPGGPRLRVWASGGAPHMISYGGWRARLEPDAILYAGADLMLGWPLVVERVMLPWWVMRERPDVLALHGAALELDGRALVVLGGSGVGKSSTVAEALRCGARLLADDMVLIDLTRQVVLPGAPTLRLWRPPELPTTTSASIPGMVTKRWYRLSDALGCTTATPLLGVLALQRHEDAPTLGHTIAPARALDALTLALRHTLEVTHPSTARTAQRLTNTRALIDAHPPRIWRFSASASGAPEHVAGLLDLLRDEASHAR